MTTPSSKKSTKAKKEVLSGKPIKTESTLAPKTSIESETVSGSENSIFKAKKRNTPLILSVALVAILVALGYFFYRTELVVATVNGKPISRLELAKELEKESGTKTLDTMITKQLILDEAKKQNITISDADVAPDVKQIEDSVTAQGQKLDDLLTAQGMTRATLIEQIKMNKMVEKMATKDIAVSDEEIANFIKQNESTFPANTDKATMQEQAKAQLEQQKKSEAIQTWIMGLRSKAKIVYLKTLS